VFKIEKFKNTILYIIDWKKCLEAMKMKRVMNPKKIDDRRYIYAVFEIDDEGKETLKSGTVYIAKFDKRVRKEVYNGDGSLSNPVSYSINITRANAYRMRNIKKFFAVVNSEYDKEFVKEKRDEFRKIIGEINSEIFKIIEENKISQEDIIGFEVLIGLDGDNNPRIAEINVDVYRVVSKYPVCMEEKKE